MTLPSTASRRIRLGEPTSSLPSGVTVAALTPKPAARMAAAASLTHAFCVSRRALERQVVMLELDLRRRRRRGRARGSPARAAPGPSRRHRGRRSAADRSCAPSPARSRAARARRPRDSSAAITKARCSSKSTPSSSAPGAQLVAVDGGGEGRRLHLLLDRLRRQAVDARRPHVGAGHDEARQLVDGVQGLLEPAVARDARGSRRARRPRGPAPADSRGAPAPPAPCADGRSRGRDSARSRGRGGGR